MSKNIRETINKELTNLGFDPKSINYSILHTADSVQIRCHSELALNAIKLTNYGKQFFEYGCN